MRDRVLGLIASTVGACTCLTKTPEWKYHNSQCPVYKAGVRQRHPLCLGVYDQFTGDYDCEYKTKITCEDCKYGVGRRDPAAKVNQIGG